MNSSWRIGTLFGVSIRVHWTLILFLGWTFIAHLPHDGLQLALRGVATVLMVFVFVVLHECAHALTAKRFGITTKDIVLLPIGGVARLQQIPSDPIQEIVIAIAGPLFNLAVALLLALIITLAYGFNRLLALPDASTPMLIIAFFFNVAMAIFNLIPAFPMDGGRVLRAALVPKLGYLKATEVAARVGQAISVFFALVGLFTNGMLLFIALLVFLGAQQESVSTRARHLLTGVPVREAMRKKFLTLKSDDRVELAIQEITAGNQHDFPIVNDEHQLRGMIYRDDLIGSLGHDSKLFVEDLAHRNCESVPMSATLEQVLDLMNDHERRVLPVVDQGTVAGLISLENIGEWLMIHASETDAKHPSAVDVRRNAKCV